MKVQNKTIVVTGAGSGMGRELCLLLLKKGAKVAGVDLNATALEETAKIAAVGDTNFKAFVVNITDRSTVEKLPEEVVAHFGAVDGVINNAGIIQKFIPINDLSLEEIQKVLNVNFYGTVYLIKAFLPILLKRPEAHILNVSSMGGFFAFPGQTIYGASKAAVKMMTEGMIQELRNTNVHVSVVFPGAINTNIMANSGLDQKVDQKEAAKQNSMLLSADKAAEIIINSMEKNKKRIFVGNDAKIMDLLYRLSPNRAVSFIAKKMGHHLPKD